MWLSYYMFVNFGVMPDEVASHPRRARLLAFEMAKKEMRSRPKG